MLISYNELHRDVRVIKVYINELIVAAGAAK